MLKRFGAVVKASSRRLLPASPIHHCTGTVPWGHWDRQPSVPRGRPASAGIQQVPLCRWLATSGPSQVAQELGLDEICAGPSLSTGPQWKRDIYHALVQPNMLTALTNELAAAGVGGGAAWSRARPPGGHGAGLQVGDVPDLDNVPDHISLTELRKAMHNADPAVTEEQVQARFNAMDVDRSGRVSREEQTRVLIKEVLILMDHHNVDKILPPCIDWDVEAAKCAKSERAAALVVVLRSVRAHVTAEIEQSASRAQMWNQFKKYRDSKPAQLMMALAGRVALRKWAAGLLIGSATGAAGSSYFSGN
jgi:hypothetical protein